MEIHSPDCSAAGEALRAEIQRIRDDPTHELHADYLRGGQKSTDYLSRRYAEIYGKSKVQIGEGLSLEAGGPGDKRTHRPVTVGGSSNLLKPPKRS